MPHYPGKKSDFLRGNLFQVFPLVLPEDSEVARTRKRRECGLHKKSLWLAFLSLSDKIKSKSINFLFRNFHSFVFNPIPAASTLSPQLQPYPRSLNPIPAASTLFHQLQPYPRSFNPIPSASTLSPHLQSESNYWLLATHSRQSLDEALESQIVFWYLQATFLTLF